MSNYHGEATLSLKNCSWHVDISFLQTEPKGFNVIDTVVIKCLVVCKCAQDNEIYKFGADKIVEIFGRAEQDLLTLCVGYLTPLGKQIWEVVIFLYLNNWKQTVSSIVFKIPVCYKLVFLSLVQGLEHSVIKEQQFSCWFSITISKTILFYHSIVFKRKFSGLKRIQIFNSFGLERGQELNWQKERMIWKAKTIF